VDTRVATAADLGAVTATISTAFHDDPLWSWAFPDAERRPAQYAAWWGFLIEAALRYPWVLVTERCESAAVWIPPAGTELPKEAEAQAGALLVELLGPHSEAVLELLDRFEASHPRDEPHFYLSLLGTHDDHRGRGLGMGLLAESLGRIDAERMPAYLESTNPVNIPRYERLGFVARGTFEAPGGGPVVTTMWRPPGP
jgi:GNAT superfamily N-acetyltransferase